MSKQKTEGLNYKSAGVDIAMGNILVEQIKPIAKRTRIAGVMSDLGGFGSMFELPHGYKQPILVSSTDGVGTKLKFAIDLNKHDTIGIDLVGMCVNDIIVQGAEMLFFLDYFASGKLNLKVATSVIEGIGKGCELAGIALIGGETAEMPGMYADDEYDLAGFCVGVVEKKSIIDGSKITAGNQLIGIASSGLHSNGYSLVRKIIQHNNSSLTEILDGKLLSERLLEPTRIYVKPLLQLIKKVSVYAVAHITGGGITENVPRILPHGLSASIKLNAWQFPAIFQWLQEQGDVTRADMLTTFNCGIGMIVCVASEDTAATIAILNKQGEQAFVIGEIIDTPNKNQVVYQ